MSSYGTLEVASVLSQTTDVQSFNWLTKYVVDQTKLTTTSWYIYGLFFFIDISTHEFVQQEGPPCSTTELGPIWLSTVRIGRNETGLKSPFLINKSYLSFSRTSFTLEIGTQVLLSTLYSPSLRSDSGRRNSYWSRRWITKFLIIASAKYWPRHFLVPKPNAKRLYRSWWHQRVNFNFN